MIGGSLESMQGVPDREHERPPQSEVVIGDAIRALDL
jgi:hypothetical protein